jgi:hypothetical protein
MLTQDQVLSVRKDFFSRLEREWTRPPERIDQIMGQSQYYIAPEPLEGHAEMNPGGERVFDPEHGLLLRSFLVSANDGQSSRTLRFFYSILQAGDWLRFGILIRGDQQAHELLNAKRQMDLERVWDRSADIVQRGPDSQLVEWRFVEPDFYHNFAIQERFAQVARHLHFRLGWAIHRHLSGYDEEDSEEEFGGLDGIDGGRAQLFSHHPD